MTTKRDIVADENRREDVLIEDFKNEDLLHKNLQNGTKNLLSKKENKLLHCEDSFLERFEIFFGFKTKVVWASVIGISLLHIATAVVMMDVLQLKWQTFFFAFLMGGIVAFGVTGGAHRYWTHRSYKAKLPLRIILMLCFSASGQNSLYIWTRDHRVHHKHAETDADPHNSKRGFFFAHVGWLMMKRHPEVLRRGKQLDMSDVLADPVVQFHEKYFNLMKLMFCFIIPSLIPMMLWNETLLQSVISQCLIRYTLSLNFTWSVNSFAHIWGNRPYDKEIKPAENKLVSFVALGEGWHNYHHAFPWDYKAAELGNYGLNLTTMWIDFFAWLGWAYDLKQPSKSLVRAVAENNGDGTHPVYSDLIDQSKDR